MDELNALKNAVLPLEPAKRKSATPTCATSSRQGCWVRTGRRVNFDDGTVSRKNAGTSRDNVISGSREVVKFWVQFSIILISMCVYPATDIVYHAILDDGGGHWRTKAWASTISVSSMIWIYDCIKQTFQSTVKVSDFGPHGNFKPFVARSVASLAGWVPKMNRTEFANLTFFYHLNFLYFPVGRVLMIARPSEKGPNFTRGSKLEVLTVRAPIYTNNNQLLFTKMVAMLQDKGALVWWTLFTMEGAKTVQQGYQVLGSAARRSVTLVGSRRTDISRSSSAVIHEDPTSAGIENVNSSGSQNIFRTIKLSVHESSDNKVC
jgi:hypothetical protein